MSREYIHFGKWWAVQVVPVHALSLGIHVEPRVGLTGDATVYGPYIDLHLGPAIISLGRHPVFTPPDELDRHYSRGGQVP